MREGEQSVTTLTESFTSMVNNLSEINKALADIEDSSAKDKILHHYRETNDKVQSSIIAFQFYDRMQQCLQHVTENLTGLSDIVDSPQLLYNPIEWGKLQDKIRKGYTMESEKVMFDAILQGKTIEQAMQLAAEHVNSNDDDADDIELF